MFVIQLALSSQVDMFKLEDKHGIIIHGISSVF